MRNVVFNCKKLKDKDLKNFSVPGKLYISESMAPAYKSMDWKCCQLKKAGYLKQCWFFNGTYNIELNDDEVKKKIYHVKDLANFLSITEEEIDEICLEWKDKSFN